MIRRRALATGLSSDAGLRALGLFLIVVLGLCAGFGVASQGRLVTVLLLLAPILAVPLVMPSARLFVFVSLASIVSIITVPPWFDLGDLTGVEGDNRINVPRLIILAQAVVAAAFATQSIVRGGAARARNRFVAADLLFLGWALFASLSVRDSLDPSAPKNFLQTVFFAACFYPFSRLSALDPRDLRRLVQTLGVCGGLLAATILFENLTHRPFLPAGEPNHYSHLVYQSSGLLASPTTSAFVLLLVIPISFLFWRSEGPRHILTKIFTGLLCVCLFLTFSRSALIGAVLGSAIFLAISGKVRRLAAILLAIGVVLVFAWPWVADTGWYQDRILDRGTAMDRVTFLEEAGRILATQKMSWLAFGIGYDNFRHFRMLDSDSWERASLGYIESESYPTHNTHLTVLLEMGVVAFVCWAGMHLLYLRSLFRFWKGEPSFRAKLAGALLLSEIAFLIAANGHTMTPDYSVLALFWFFFGQICHPAGVFQEGDRSPLPAVGPGRLT